MSERIATIFNEFIVEFMVAVIFYLFGVFTSRLISKVKSLSFEKKFHDKAALAVNLIYEAEEQLVGEHRGLEKLEYVTKKFVNVYKDMGCESAQDFIMKMFNLTKLAK